MARMSRVRTRVASNDWCASRQVVSVSSRPWLCRTAFANPSGPSSVSTCLRPRGCKVVGDAAIRGVTRGVTGPDAPAAVRPLTTRSPGAGRERRQARARPETPEGGAAARQL